MIEQAKPVICIIFIQTSSRHQFFQEVEDVSDSKPKKSLFSDFFLEESTVSTYRVQPVVDWKS